MTKKQQSRGKWRENNPEYQVWRGMRKRCNSPSRKDYHNYGGRGIRVCERWNESYRAFADDMGSRPTANHQIDRIDNDGNYEPSNCRWVHKRVNDLNRRQTRWITHRGRTMCISDWAKEIGIPRGTLYQRIDNGWDIKRAMTQPTPKMRRSMKTI